MGLGIAGIAALALLGRRGGSGQVATMGGTLPSTKPPTWPLVALGGASAAWGAGELLKHLPDTFLDLPTPPAIPPAAPPATTFPKLFGDWPPLPTEVQPAPSVWTPPPDTRWLELAPHPSVILIIGRRESGKSALGYRLLELNRHRATPYVVGVPSQSQKLLPEWVGVANKLEDVPGRAVVLLDEAYLQLHARNSMSEAGRDIGPLVNLSRQRGQSLIFVVQEARQLDINVISQTDVIAVKQLTDVSQDFERRELRRFTDRARAAFATVQGNRQRWTWIHSERADFEGLVESDSPPSKLGGI